MSTLSICQNYFMNNYFISIFFCLFLWQNYFMSKMFFTSRWSTYVLSCNIYLSHSFHVFDSKKEFYLNTYTWKHPLAKSFLQRTLLKSMLILSFNFLYDSDNNLYLWAKNVFSLRDTRYFQKDIHRKASSCYTILFKSIL